MEIANVNWRVRQATENDKTEIHRLLSNSIYRHIHADWRPPLDWLGGPGFVVGGSPEQVRLDGCLAVGQDPPPAAWVRVAALRRTTTALSLLEKMLEEVWSSLEANDASELAWIAGGEWPESWMHGLGFEMVDEVESFVKRGLDLPPLPPVNSNLVIKPVTGLELPALAEIEERAFAPRWRHSAHSLSLGRYHAISFQVAYLNDTIVGFQYSTRSGDEDGAHLVRLTVDPAVQKQGVGTSLLLAAFESYQDSGVKRVSLNTQADNIASKHLYERFGFESVGYYMPVWSQIV